MTAVEAYARGRLDARDGERQILFGQMYEDPAIERAAFAPGGRVFCIASAGCTAMALASDHEVVAIDVNPAQIAYTQRRAAGGGVERGTVDRLLGHAHALAPAVGWSRARVGEFLALDDPAAQIAFWREHLDTWRFRTAFDTLLSVTALRAVYSSPLLSCLPPRLGAVMRARFERGFARHSNRSNPYARALLVGDAPPAQPPPTHAFAVAVGDAADYLEHVPAGSFDGFSLSNILDGADPAYGERLFAAIRHAARPNAVVVLRSFSEPATPEAGERAGDDRALIWGSIDVQRVP